MCEIERWKRRIGSVQGLRVCGGRRSRGPEFVCLKVRGSSMGPIGTREEEEKRECCCFGKCFSVTEGRGRLKACIQKDHKEESLWVKGKLNVLYIETLFVLRSKVVWSSLASNRANFYLNCTSSYSIPRYSCTLI